MTHFREPSLYDLLNDPVVHLVMKADGVTKTDILELYARDDDILAESPPAYICNGILKSGFRPEA
jgi:hypothetical protein